MKRAGIIFVATLVSPLVFAYIVNYLGQKLGVDRLQMVAFVLLIWWKAIVYPHDGMHPPNGLPWSRTFPGFLAPLDAIAQWTIVLLLVAWCTRRAIPSVQCGVSVMAILVVGLVFAAVMSYFGVEMEHLSI
jgi:hypothetical protein